MQSEERTVQAFPYGFLNGTFEHIFEKEGHLACAN
jgi:hypothetical protein